MITLENRIRKLEKLLIKNESSYRAEEIISEVFDDIKRLQSAVKDLSDTLLDDELASSYSEYGTQKDRDFSYVDTWIEAISDNIAKLKNLTLRR